MAPDVPGDAAVSARLTLTPHGFEQRLLKRARGARFQPGDRVVVAFSGGRDSLALAAASRWIVRRLGVELQLVHVDHALRASSGTEATRAVDLARALGLTCRVVRLGEHPTRVHPGVGVEEAARRERYRVLCGVAVSIDAKAVATAHHQQDQAETVLLHVLRGGGVHGAAGMAEWSVLPTSSGVVLNDISQEMHQPQLWRPLLHEPQSAIDDYTETLGLTPIGDPSNFDLNLRRNRVRHQVLPCLEAALPGATAALARFADLAAEDDRLLDHLAAAALSTMAASDAELPVSSLLTQPLALQRRIVRRWLAQLEPTALSMERTEAVLGLAKAGRGNRGIEIGVGWTIQRQRGMLRAIRAGEAERGGEP